MPLLEVIQTRQVSASIRLTDSTATQVDQYAAFIQASADDVVEQALAYVFSKDRDFQDFLKTPQAKQASSTLRIRRAPANDAAEPPAKKPASAASSPAQPAAFVGGIEGMIPLLHRWQGHYGAAHRKRMTLDPFQGGVLQGECFRAGTSFAATTWKDSVSARKHSVSRRKQGKRSSELPNDKRDIEA